MPALLLLYRQFLRPKGSTMQPRVSAFSFFILAILLPQVGLAAPDVAQLMRTSASGIVAIQSVRLIKVTVPEVEKKAAQTHVYQAYSHIFHEVDAPVNAAPVTSTVKKKTNGSGFILNRNGTVVTNYQFVKGAQELYVVLADKRRFKARLGSVDSKRDLAVLNISATNLEPLPQATHIADGEWVLAIGANQKGASAGRIISGESAALITDADVTAANSGGPLLNAQGEVLGMNSTALRLGAGAARHVAVNSLSRDAAPTVPSNQTWPKLGLSAQDITPNLQTQTLKADGGAWVSQVTKGSAAAKAGLQKGDVIRALESIAISNAADLAPLTELLDQNDTVQLTVLRADTLQIVQLAQPMPAKRSDISPVHQLILDKTGLIIQEISTAAKASLQIEHGVQVSQASNAAARIGFEIGDIILSANLKKTDSAQQLYEQINATQKDEALLLYVQRNGVPQFVELPLN
jgi:serine protease Do